MVSLGGIARKLFGSSNDRRVRSYKPRVDAINALEPQMKALSDEALDLPAERLDGAVIQLGKRRVKRLRRR